MKILIAEDDEEIGKMLERAFRFSGFEVDWIHDGKTTLEHLRKSEILPDAIIMDVIMPEMSGLDLLMKVKKETYLKNIPVMILTNSFLEENAEQFLALGADMYLVKIDHKPVDIVDKINKLIESKKNIK
jgi:DNA-binding response OmpR family regulator